MQAEPHELSPVFRVIPRIVLNRIEDPTGNDFTERSTYLCKRGEGFNDAEKQDIQTVAQGYILMLHRAIFP